MGLEPGRYGMIENVLGKAVGKEAKESDLNMLVMLGGQERTADDFERLYAEAGFRLSDIIRTGSSMAIIEGVPV